MENYLESKTCRREVLLRYFSGSSSDLTGTSNCCDNCSALIGSEDDFFVGEIDNSQFEEKTVEKDFASEAKILIGAVIFFKNYMGLGKIVKFIRGSKSKDLPEWASTGKLYGKGSEKREEFWKALAEQLVLNGFLVYNQKTSSTGFKFSLVGTTQKGKNFLYAKEGSLKLSCKRGLGDGF